MERVFAFEKAEVSVCVSRRHGIGKMALHVSMCLSADSYSKETGKRPIPCSRLSLPQDEAVETEIGASSDLLRSVKPPMSCLFQESELEEMNTRDEGPLTFPPVPCCCLHEHGIVPRLEGRVSLTSESNLNEAQLTKPDRLH